IPTYYSAVRHYNPPPLALWRKIVQLAYLRHAASVHPELGSNSQKNILSAFYPLNIPSRVKIKGLAFELFVCLFTMSRCEINFALLNIRCEKIRQISIHEIARL